MAREPSFARRDQWFAGRDAELSRLEAEWDGASQGSWRVTLVCGEPGIGKTRLAAELSSRVYRQGGAVLYGRCDEDTIVPYQPFVEALRPCLERARSPEVAARLRGSEEPLARVFPAELSDRVPATTLPGDPEAERYRLFEAMTALLTAATLAQPTLLVLDDLQWADRPTLLLFRHIVRAAPQGTLLVLVCYRDVELHAHHPLSETLADIRRDALAVTRSTLAGLSKAESGRLLRALVGRDVGDRAVNALHAGTQGNPFFLGELVRDLVERGALARLEEAGSPAAGDSLGLPDSVRELVAGRLSRLPEEVAALLEMASVIGPGFDAQLLSCAAAAPVDEVVDLLDVAVDTGLVQEDSTRVERYVFSHALVRQTLIAELGRRRAARLHADIVRALETMEGVELRAAELAWHCVAALPLVDPAKAIEHTRRAGHEALAEFAFEDAATHFQTALDVLDRFAPSEAALRVAVLTEHADALVYVDERAGVDAARRAVEAARLHGSAAQFGRAVAVFVEPMYAVEAFPVDIAAVFTEAHDALGDREPALRARLLAFESFKYVTHWLTGRDGQALAEAAVALARECGDSLALADALLSLASSLEGQPTVDARLTVGEELVALGPEAGARATAFGLRVLAGVYLERGQAEALTSTIDELERVGNETHWLPARVYAAQWSTTQALLEGRFDDVRAHGAELGRHSRAYRGAAGLRLFQALHLGLDIGDLRDLPLTDEVEVRARDDIYTSALGALLQLESIDSATARAQLDVLLDQFTGKEHDTAWGPALAVAAEIAATCDAAEPAAVLHQRLTPFQGQLIAVYVGIACLGAADRYLGMLSTVLHQWDDAEAHFDRALLLEAQCRGHALLPRTNYWKAKFLGARGRAGDDRTARELLTTVIADTSRLGMHKLTAQATKLRTALH